MMNSGSVWTRTLVAMSLSAVAIGAAMHGSLVSLGTLWWESSGYGHGLFVVPMCGYAVWLLRDQLAQMEPRPAWLGVLGMAIAWTGWVVSVVADIRVGQWFSLTLLMSTMVLSFVGWRAARVLWFPLLFPFLAIPIWDVLTNVLQNYTATAATLALREFGIPIFLEGFYIAIPAGNFEIAESCAGLRYVLAIAAISTFYVFLNGLTLWSGIGFVGLALTWGVLFNWIRVIGIILAGHWTDMQSDLVHDHLTYGWIVFAFALIPLFYVGRWFPVRTEARPVALAATPVSRWRLATPLAVALLAAAGAHAVVLATADSDARLAGEPRWPQTLGAWKRVSYSPDWRPEKSGAAWQGLVSYADPSGRQVFVFAALYASETQDAELVNTAKKPYSQDRWSVFQGPGPVAAATGAVFSELVLRDGRGARRVLWHAYRIGGVFERGNLRAKLRQVPLILTGRPSGALLAVSTDVSGTVEEARAALHDFSNAGLMPIVAEVDVAGGTSKP